MLAKHSLHLIQIQVDCNGNLAIKMYILEDLILTSPNHQLEKLDIFCFYSKLDMFNFRHFFLSNNCFAMITPTKN